MKGGAEGARGARRHAPRNCQHGNPKTPDKVGQAGATHPPKKNRKTTFVDFYTNVGCFSVFFWGVRA